MGLIVQKFGGTSVADTEKILAAARKAIRAQHEGNQVVVVVSAMGRNTDTLVELAKQLNERPPARELDMLLSTGEQVSVALMAMAIEALGHKAISMTGAQIGIRTDSTHTKARIKSISTDRIRKALDTGHIVVAAGFQGIDEDFNITTLGRGGSDTTAVALAAVLGADSCEIYTDVDGVYTTDPRLLPEARMTKRVSYDEMLELASLGAGVMHSRAIEFGKKFSVPIHVRSSFSDIPGTLITTVPESARQPVSGATLVKDEALVTLEGVPDRPGASLAVFSKIADKAISVDMIVQNVGDAGLADISFTVLADDLPATLEAVAAAAAELGASGWTCNEDVSKVSVVGGGMAQQTGVANRMFRALADENINILLITTSEIKISELVRREHADQALRVVHQTFDLDKEPPDSLTDASQFTAHAEARDAIDVVKRLQGMERLTIEDVSLDDSQARVTITEVPDEPGIAAQAFEEIALKGIFIDMIVQSLGREGRANLSFTVPRTDLTGSLELAGAIAKRLGCGSVTHSPRIAKLSVSGIGMRSHTSVAIRMFEALADAGINVAMISTSEMRINVVVDGSEGASGLSALENAFQDVER